MNTPALALGLVLSVSMLGSPVLAAGADDPGREARWQEIAAYFFDGRTLEPTDTLIKIEAPKRAQDAALVPITLTTAGGDIRGVHLVIDDNPSPYAAHFTFGPAADPTVVKLRVRVNTYTNVHAVAEATHGKLYQAVAFVKASGGCSAPIGVTDEEAMQGMGTMKMKFAGDPLAGGPVEAMLMVRHPNFSGMQMNQLTRLIRPAHYIDKIVVTYGDTEVVTIAGDISISSDPVFNFSFRPDGPGPMKVVVTDTEGGRWEQTFETTTVSN